MVTKINSKRRKAFQDEETNNFSKIRQFQLERESTYKKRAIAHASQDYFPVNNLYFKENKSKNHQRENNHKTFHLSWFVCMKMKVNS